MSTKNLLVKKIPNKDSHYYILNHHYAHRLPPISYAFGLFREEELVGICTFGRPMSPNLRAGICGKEYEDLVFELNRLYSVEGLDRNALSYFVSRCLKLLPKPTIIISYADTSAGHLGYIYQACNFIYTGLSAKRTDWKIRGEEHLHGATIADRSRGIKGRAKYMRELYGDRFYLKERPRKHRYLYFLGNKKQTKEFRSKLRYPIKEYPK